MAEELRNPWLIAVWPGMGNVALAGGAYLVDKLDANMVHQLSARDIFDIEHIEVQEGIASIGHQPRSMFFEWKDPQQQRDLLIFLGEAQPNHSGYRFCHELMDYAVDRGVERVITFAAMASQLHPSSDPRVFGVSTDRSILSELRPLDVEILKEGQISGLNGVLLAAAAERSVPGICLMGELPFFAAGVPNPKASMAVLDIFAKLANINIDLSDIARQAEAVEEGLIQLLEKMKQAARDQSEEGFTVPEFLKEDHDDDEDEEESEPKEEREKEKKPAVDYATRQRIEALFKEAERDRSMAFQLKEELDRLGIFELYEDRFLDLFKKAE